MRDELSRQLRVVQDDLLRMSSRVEHAVALALSALATWDHMLAQQIIARDAEIDEAYSQLEDRVFNLLATQQPILGRDLRALHATMFIASELERMGDYAKSIARNVLICLQAPKLPAPPAVLLTMATITQEMIGLCIESLIRMDPTLARSLGDFDTRVDLLNSAVRSALIELARADPRCIEGVMALHDIAHRIERLADRVTNIAERVLFVTTNRMETLNS